MTATLRIHQQNICRYSCENRYKQARRQRLSLQENSYRKQGRLLPGVKVHRKAGFSRKSVGTADNRALRYNAGKGF